MESNQLSLYNYNYKSILNKRLFYFLTQSPIIIHIQTKMFVPHGMSKKTLEGGQPPSAACLGLVVKPPLPSLWVVFNLSEACAIGSEPVKPTIYSQHVIIIISMC